VPVAIAAAGVAVSVAATVASVAAAQQQAQNQQKAANYNSQVSANNAQVATWQRQQQQQEYATEAYITQQEGAQNASRIEMQNGALMARNVAAAAAAGMTLTGSTDTSIAGSAANNELATLNEEHGTQIKAYENQIGAANASYNSTIQINRYNDESGLYSMAGRNAATSGMYSEVGAGLGGASKTLSAVSMGQDQLQTLFDD